MHKGCVKCEVHTNQGLLSLKAFRAKCESDPTLCYFWCPFCQCRHNADFKSDEKHKLILGSEIDTGESPYQKCGLNDFEKILLIFSGDWTKEIDSQHCFRSFRSPEQKEKHNARLKSVINRQLENEK